MATSDITEILRDMSAGKKNELGDRWHSSYCDIAADEIEALRKEVKALKEELEVIIAGEDA